MEEVALRTLLLTLSLGLVPIWFYKVHSKPKKIKSPSVQGFIGYLGIVLILWLNPVYTVAQFTDHVSDSMRLAIDTVQACGEALLYTLYLLIIASYNSKKPRISRNWIVLLGVCNMAAELFLRLLQYQEFSTVLIHHRSTWLVLGAAAMSVIRSIWIVLCFSLVVESGKALEGISYIETRDVQLSYRFFMLQTVLILISVLVHYVRCLATLCTVLFGGETAETLTNSYMEHQSLASLSYLPFCILMIMYVHLPALVHGTFRQKGYLVREAASHSSRGSLFCVETSSLMVELAWQAYFDPVGQPSTDGHGELNLGVYDFELVAMLREELIGTNVIIIRNKKRIVIAFRGSTNRKNWLTNLRANQENIQVVGSTSGRSCWKTIKHWMSGIPILNMAIPRVHSGIYLVDY